MAGIFISYRRDDAAAYAGHLQADLAQRFGPDRVFMDITALEPGVPFGTALDRAVTTCDVLLAVIGPRWLSVADESGRRLDNPADFVRREVATALARDDIRVIPVLVGNAAPPAAAELPEPLKALADRHAFEITDERWDYDVGRLVAALERLVKPPEVGPDSGLLRRPSRKAVIPLVGGLAAGGAVVAWELLGDNDIPDPIPTPTVTQEPSFTPTPTQEPSFTPTPTQEPSFTPTPTDTVTAVADVTLDSGHWKIHANGFNGDLLIDSVEAGTGKLRGTIFGDEILGYWNGVSGTITLMRVAANQSDFASFQIYTGHHLFDGGDPQKRVLTGHFESFSVAGSSRVTFGWYATIRVP